MLKKDSKKIDYPEKSIIEKNPWRILFPLSTSSNNMMVTSLSSPRDHPFKGFFSFFACKAIKDDTSSFHILVDTKLKSDVRSEQSILDWQSSSMTRSFSILFEHFTTSFLILLLSQKNVTSLFFGGLRKKVERFCRKIVVEISASFTRTVRFRLRNACRTWAGRKDDKNHQQNQK